MITRISRPHISGFTMIELMVTLAILAILVALAAPSIDRQLRLTRLDADTEKLQSALAYTRSEARKRSAAVSMVPNSGNYAQGWTIIVDDATELPDCTLDTAEDEVLLRVQDALAPSTQVFMGQTNADGSVNCSAAVATTIACTPFIRTGTSVIPSPGTGGLALQTFCVRDSQTPTTFYRALTVNASGEVHLVKSTN